MAYSEQKLSSRVRRFLLTYEKQTEPNDEIRVSEKHEEIDVPEADCSSDYNIEFRDRYFTNNLEAQERKLRKAQLKEEGRQQALKRGKIIENGRVISRKPSKLPENEK